MRRLSLASTLICVLLTPAAAADLGPYSPRQPPAFYEQPYRPFSWAGFYVGIQAGYGWGDSTAVSGPLSGFNQAYSYSDSGFLGGVHAGYNWQLGNVVLGAESDFELSDLGGGGVGTLGYGHTTDLNWLGSLRARVGMNFDRTLVYATGGLAYGDVKVTKAFSPGGASFSSYDNVRTGWTLGAGVEHALGDNVSLRLEYRYTDLGHDTVSSTAANSIDRSTLDFSTLRAGMSWRF